MTGCGVIGEIVIVGKLWYSGIARSNLHIFARSKYGLVDILNLNPTQFTSCQSAQPSWRYSQINYTIKGNVPLNHSLLIFSYFRTLLEPFCRYLQRVPDACIITPERSAVVFIFHEYKKLEKCVIHE